MKNIDLSGFDRHMAQLMRDNPSLARGYAREFAKLPLTTQLAILRRRRWLSQAAVAKTLRVKQPHVARTERADHDPRLSSIVNQARALGCRVLLVPEEYLARAGSFSLVREPSFGEADLKKIKRLGRARNGKSFKTGLAAKAYLKSI